MKTLKDWQERIFADNRIAQDATKKEICEALDIIASDMMAGKATMNHANVLLSLRFALMSGQDKKSELSTLEAASALGSIKTAKKAASSAENGKKGGRPKSSAPTSKQISEAFDSIGLPYAKKMGNVYQYIKAGDIQTAFGTVMASDSHRTEKQHEFKLALKAIRERDSLKITPPRT